MDEALPAYAIAAMREALPAFGRKIRGYDMADAVLTGVETRTSSPLRIDRGEDFQSLNTPACTRRRRRGLRRRHSVGGRGRHQGRRGRGLRPAGPAAALIGRARLGRRGLIRPRRP
jgi:hypothetical protein